MPKTGQIKTYSLRVKKITKVQAKQSIEDDDFKDLDKVPQGRLYQYTRTALRIKELLV